MAITQTYRIDLIPNGAPVVVHVSQYDNIARVLAFSLYSGGQTYTVPAGSMVAIGGTKPDGNAFSYPMTVSGSTVSIALEEQMAVVAGDVKAEIRISDGNGGLIGSTNFIIRVEEAALETGAISDSDIPIIDEFINNGTAGQIFKRTAASGEWVDPSSIQASTEWGNIDGDLSDQTDLQTALNSKANLDSGGKVPSSELPSYVDDVLEYASVSQFPATGETGKIYVATDTNTSYRWSGSQYIMVGNPIIVDPSPVQDSANAVSSGGAYSALANQKYFYIDSEGYGCINYDLFQTA